MEIRICFNEERVKTKGILVVFLSKETYFIYIKQMQGSDKSSLSVCFIGDVASGKSTLAAHLAFRAGTFTTRELEKVEKSEGFSREKRFSWLLDRSHQVTFFFFFFFFSFLFVSFFVFALSRLLAL